MTDREQQRYTFDRFTMDLSRACLLRDGEQLSLRPRAFDALRYLIENRGRLATKEELVEALWPRAVVTDDSLVKCIQDVRTALGDDAHRYIKTVQRRGYIFDAPVVVEAVPATPTSSAAAPSTDVTARETGDAAPRPDGPSTDGGGARPLVRRRFAPVALGSAAIFAVVLLGTLYALGHRDADRAAALPRSIAVLPFENLSADPDNEYFAAGIHESLLDQLARINGVKAIARTSVLRYVGSDKPIHEIARELNVQTVMEGSVQYADGRVRVTAQLIDPATDTHLWSEAYDRPFADIFAIQTEIAGRIAAALDIELTSSERQTIAVPGTRSPEAYEMYLRGRYHWDKWTGDEAAKSVEYFTEAIRYDPNYALAYAGLANAYTALYGLGAGPPDELMPTAKAAVARALEIDPQLPEAYIARGLIKHFYDWDYASGNADFERAIALNPNSATAHHLYGKNLPITWEFDKAFAELEHALQLEPYSNGINKDLGETLYYARRYDDAIAQFGRTLELEPNSPSAYFWLLRCYEARGLQEKAIEAYAKRLGAAGVKSDGSQVAPSRLLELEEIYRTSGWHAYWLRRLELLNEDAERQFIEPYRYVEIYVRLGDADAAFRWLDTAFQRRSSWIGTINVDPLLDPLRTDPRFAELVHRVGLPADPKHTKSQ